MTATTNGQAVSRLADQVSEIAEIRRKPAGHALVDHRDGVMGMQGLQVGAGDDEVADAGVTVELLERIVLEHLKEGRVVEDAVFHRMTAE